MPDGVPSPYINHSSHALRNAAMMRAENGAARAQLAHIALHHASQTPSTNASTRRVQTVAESLRLYPQPPVLIRRAEQDLTLPQGTSAFPQGFDLAKGCDIFISTWNLHRSPHLWERAAEFDPARFDRPSSGAEVPGWKGYKPDSQGSSMYPNEVGG